MSWTVQKINKFVFTHPTRGGSSRGGLGGWGLKFQKSGKFHELSRKSIKIFLPPPTKGGRSGNFRGSKNQKSGKCHELSRKSIQFVFTHPTRGGGEFQGGGVGGVGGVNISKVRSISWTVEKIDKKKVYPPPTKGGRSGNFRGSKVQEMSWTAEKSNNKKLTPHHPTGGWEFYG